MIYTIRNITFSSNTYIVSDDISRHCIIIDPGIDVQLAENTISENNLSPLAIVCTHGHFDHIANVSFFKEKYNIPFYIHEYDLKAVKTANFFLKVTKIDFKIKTPVPDVLFKENITSLSIGKFNFIIRNFPGHSPGSCIIEYENNLFSGDIIYKKGLGFNSFPDENKNTLRESVKEIFAVYTDNCMIYPGHGGAEKLGIIKECNKELAGFLMHENITND